MLGYFYSVLSWHCFVVVKARPMLTLVLYYPKNVITVILCKTSNYGNIAFTFFKKSRFTNRSERRTLPLFLFRIKMRPDRALLGRRRLETREDIVCLNEHETFVEDIFYSFRLLLVDIWSIQFNWPLHWLCLQCIRITVISRKNLNKLKNQNRVIKEIYGSHKIN